MGANTGGRAPTLFDLTGTELARSNDLQVPNTELKRENFITYDVSAKYTGKVTASVRTYYTALKNIIIRKPTGRGTGSVTEVVGDNSGTGEMYGITLDAATNILSVGLDANLSYTRGNLTEFNNGVLQTSPYSRIPPLLVNVTSSKVIYTNTVLKVYYTWAGKQDRLSYRDIADNQRIPLSGAASYTLLGSSLSYEIAKKVSINLGIDNIFNTDYRTIGSGVNGYGRNYIISTSINW